MPALLLDLEYDAVIGRHLNECHPAFTPFFSPFLSAATPSTVKPLMYSRVTVVDTRAV